MQDQAATNWEMLPITKAVLVITASYLVGSIPIGLIVARIARGIDIREHGSGNIGLTNIIRTLGWGPGIITGFLDFLKGYLLVFISMRMFDSADFGGVYSIYEIIIIIVAAITMLGNIYPVFLLFKGGKGVATGLGVMSALLGVYIFIPIAVFGLILSIFRFVSLASIAASISVPLTVLLLTSKLPFINIESQSALAILLSFTWAAAILILFKHTKNLKNIIAGKEPRIGKPKETELPVPESDDKIGENVEVISKSETEDV